MIMKGEKLLTMHPLQEKATFGNSFLTQTRVCVCVCIEEFSPLKKVIIVYFQKIASVKSFILL